MAFKINIADNGEKGKTYKIESNSEALVGLKLGDIIKGNEVFPQLEGYELIIQGASDKAGFPSLKEVEGPSLKRILLKYGKGMKEKRPHGLRRRKSIRGNTISTDIVQINLIVKKQGSKTLAEIFPEQAKKKEEAKTETPTEVKQE